MSLLQKMKNVFKAQIDLKIDKPSISVLDDMGGVQPKKEKEGKDKERRRRSRKRRENGESPEGESPDNKD